MHVWREFNFQTAANYYSLILAVLTSVLVKFSPPVIQHYDQQQFVDEGVYFILHFHIIVHYQRKSGQESKAESWSKKLKKELWRSAAYRLGPRGLSSMISYTPPNHAWGDTTHNGLGLFISVVNGYNVPETFLQASLIEASSPRWFTLLRSI